MTIYKSINNWMGFEIQALSSFPRIKRKNFRVYIKKNIFVGPLVIVERGIKTFQLGQ